MVTVVVITYNSEDDLPLSLESISAQSTPPSRVVVVDNASEDKSRDIAEKHGVELKTLKENIGFGAAFNHILPEIETPLVLLMNPDVRLETEFLETLTEQFRCHDTCRPGSATGKILRGEGDEIAPTSLIDSTGIYFTSSLRHLDRGSGEADNGQYQRKERVFGPTGACALYSTEALKEVGGFDDDYFMYREDADLAWRLQRAGYTSLYIPEAVAYHRRRVLPERRRQLPSWINRHSLKNRYLLRINNQTASHFLLTLPFSLPREIGILLYCIIRERESLRAYHYIWSNRHRLFQKRHSYLSTKRVSTLKLLPWFFGRRCESLS